MTVGCDVIAKIPSARFQARLAHRRCWFPVGAAILRGARSPERGFVQDVEGAAAPASAAMLRIAMDPSSGSMSAGAIMNPTTVVKTARNITRGFVSETKSGRRAVKRDHEGECRRETGITVVSTINSFQARDFFSQGPTIPSVRSFTARRCTADLRRKARHYAADILVRGNLTIRKAASY